MGILRLSQQFSSAKPAAGSAGAEGREMTAIGTETKPNPLFAHEDTTTEAGL